MYLSGAIHGAVQTIPNCGYMLTPMMGNRPDLTGMFWAADTGCFTQPEAYSDAGYFRWLSSWPDRRTCIFATAPDVVGDAVATWKRSAPVLPVIRSLGIPAALVAQDGIENMRIDWSAFDAFFIGGTTDWKLSSAAAGLVAEARRHEKWVHMGRVNSLRRLRYAQQIGCDSADGTYLAFAPDVNAVRLRRWMAAMNDKQLSLFQEAS